MVVSVYVGLEFLFAVPHVEGGFKKGEPFQFPVDGTYVGEGAGQAGDTVAADEAYIGIREHRVSVAKDAVFPLRSGRRLLSAGQGEVHHHLVSVVEYGNVVQDSGGQAGDDGGAHGGYGNPGVKVEFFVGGGLFVVKPGGAPSAGEGLVGVGVVMMANHGQHF